MVFILCSSFNDKPIDTEVIGPMGRDLFEKEQNDLLNDLKDIPKKACDRRVRTSFSLLFALTFFPSLDWRLILLSNITQINEFVKRARAAKIHAYIISHLKKEMPSMMGKSKAQQRLIDNLEDEFLKVRVLTCLSFFSPLSVSILSHMLYV